MKKRIAILSAPILLLVALVLVLASSFGGDTGTDARSEATPAEFDAVETLPGQTAKEDTQPDEAEIEDEEEEAVAENPVKKPTVEPDPPRPAVERKPPVRKKARTYKAAVLQIVTNFEKADVTVNGLKYPEYYEPGAPEGMVLPAGGPYAVLVKFGEKSKHYTVNLRPHETRLLVVELSGYNSDAPRPAPVAQRAEPQKKPQQKADAEKPDPKAPGRITVYSKPAGTVVVDGKATGDKTPGTVELENGRHEVQVQYETGSISEKKIVRVRTGSRIKLFFRERTQ